MSATIAINDLKFVIFGAGHDYTLADSGDGEVQVFSHPFVPLNSVMYAGQWYFLVPDEDGNPMDCVKDDLAHCTFTPALGSVFDTEGEVTVECNYHREYIYDEETLVVDKTVRQTIQVVNHGSVTRAGGYYPARGTWCNSDIYEDGYCFIRPRNVNTIDELYISVWEDASIKKLSSFPWRMTALGTGQNGCFRCTGLTDISELQYADTSKVTEIRQLFRYVQNLSDWSPIADWDVSNVTLLWQFLAYSKPSDLTFLSKWNVSKLSNFSNGFTFYLGASLHGIEDWDVSHVTVADGLFMQNSNITSLEPVLNWKISGIANLSSLCNSCSKLTSLHGLENWEIDDRTTNLTSAFYNCVALKDISALLTWKPKPTTLYWCFNDDSALESYHGIENFDVSNCTDFRATFNNTWKCTDLTPFADWDVSKGQTFDSMFGQCHWFTTLQPIKDWKFDSMTSATSMFGQNSALTDIDVPWEIPDGANIEQMFVALKYLYSSLLDVYVYETSMYYIDYAYNRYSKGIGQAWDNDHPMQVITKDASDAESWANGSGRNAFNSAIWSNVPSWN